MPIVTENTIYAGLTAQIGRAQSRLESAQAHASTGQRVLVAADDPVIAARSTVEAFGLGQLDGMKSAAATARRTLGSADASLRQTVSVVTRAREIAVAATNITYNPTDRANFRQEVDEMHGALLALANGQAEGSYVFAGYADSSAPFDASGTAQSDANVPRLEVAPGLTVGARVPGANVFAPPPGAGVNIFTMLSNLSTSLAAGDVPGLRDAISSSEVAMQQVTDAQATVGAQLGQVDSGDAQRDAAHDALSTALSDHLQVDMAQSFSDLLQSQAAYQAAVAEATRILMTLSNALTT